MNQGHQSSTQQILEQVRTAIIQSRPRAWIYGEVTSAISEAVSLDWIGIVCIDQDRTDFLVEFVSGTDVVGWEQGSILPLQGTISAELVERNAPVAWGFDKDHSHTNGHSPKANSVEMNWRSSLAVPIGVGGGAQGAVIVRSHRREAFDSAARELIVGVAELLAGPVANSLLNWRLGRYQSESLALAEIGRIATSSSDLSSVFRLVGEKAQSLFHFDRLVVSLIDEERQELVDSYVWGVEVPGFELRGRHTLSESPTAEIIDSKQGKVVLDTNLTESVANSPPQLARKSIGLRSSIYEPIIWQDKVIGTLNFHSRIPDAFGWIEETHAKNIAEQLAGAVAIGEAAERLRAALVERRALAVIGRSVSEALDLEIVFHRLADEVANLISYDRLAVTWFDWEARTGTIAFARGIGEGEGEVGRTYEIDALTEMFGDEISDPELDLWEWGFKLKSDSLPWHDTKSGELHELPSWLEVPLGSRGEKPVGFLSLRSAQPDAYSALDLEFLEQLSAHITPAIRNAREHEDVLTLAREQEALAEIGRVISSSSDIEDVYGQFVEHLQNVVPADRIVVRLLDADENTVTHPYVFGVSGPWASSDSTFDIDGTSTEEVIKTRSTIVLNSVTLADHVERFPHLKTGIKGGFVSGVAAPMISGDRIIGVLHIQSLIPDAYSGRSVEFVESVASQIAGAVANAQLLERARQESKLRAALAEIGKSASEDLAPSSVFERVANELSGLISHDRIAISLIEPSSGDLILEYVDGVLILGEKIGDMIPATVEGGWRWKTAAISSEASEDRRESMIGAGLQSWIEAPLGTESMGVTGYLSLRSLAEGAFTQGDLDLLERVAAQVTPAIKNARLFEETKRSSEERAIVERLGVLIGESLAIEEVFEGFCAALTEIIPSDRIAIVECDVESDSYVELYNWGLVQLGREVGTRAVFSETFSHRVIHEGNQLVSTIDEWSAIHSIYPEANPGAGHTIISTLSVRLEVRGRFTGVLHIQSKRPNAYTERDLSLATRLAVQISPAISNARDHAETLPLASEQETLARISRILGSTDALSEAMGSIAEECEKLVPYDRMVIRTFDALQEHSVDEYVVGREIPNFPQGSEHNEIGPVSKAVISTRRAVTIDDTASPKNLKNFPVIKESIDAGLRSLLSVPMISSNRVIGVIQFRALAAGVYGDSYAAVAALIADQIAGALEHDVLRQELEVSEATYRELYDDAPDIYVSIDAESRQIVQCNKAAIAQLGRSRDEIIGMPFLELYSPDSHAKAKEYFAEFRSTGKVPAGELVALRADGTTFEVSLVVTAARDDSGKIIRSRSVLRDISDQKRSEAEAMIRLAALESAADMVMITDSDGQIEYVNLAWERQTGFNKDEAIGQNMRVLNSGNEDLDFNAEILSTIGSGQTWSGQLVNRRKDGSEYPEEVTITPVMSAEGEIVHFIAIRRDISERIRVEEERERARELEAMNRELELVEVARSDFLTTVSHELRTPLTSMLAFGDILGRNKEGNLTERQKQHVDHIRKGGRRLNLLINDLLDVSRMQSGNMALEKSPMDVVQMIDEVSEANRALIHERGQTLHVADMQNAVWIDADRGRLVQVLTNLLSNASKYSPEDTIITVSVESKDDWLHIAISDRGIGISAEDQAELFSPFFRADNEETRRVSGTGLGLVVVKTIVELHGGSVEVESTVGVGTTMHLNIPGIMSEAPAHVPELEKVPVFTRSRLEE